MKAVKNLASLFFPCGIMLQPEWKLADPICTFVFSVLVLFTTFTILRDIFAILMEGKHLVSLSTSSSSLCPLLEFNGNIGI